MKLFQLELFANTMILIYLSKNFKPQFHCKIKTNNMISVILNNIEYRHYMIDFFYYKKPSLNNPGFLWKLYE